MESSPEFELSLIQVKDARAGSGKDADLGNRCILEPDSRDPFMSESNRAFSQACFTQKPLT